MEISFDGSKQPEKICVIPVYAGKKPKSLDPAFQKVVTEAGFQAKLGETRTLTSFENPSQKYVFIGLGEEKHLNEKSIRKLAAPLYRAFSAEGAKQGAVDLSALNSKLAAQLGDALLFETYSFKKYKTDKTAPAKLETLTIHAGDKNQAADYFDTLRKTTDSAFWASDLANEPGNVLNPKTYAEKIKAELAPLGIKVTVIEQPLMEQLGMGAALAVGKGSVTPPCMVVMEYDGTDNKAERPLAFVGKGITFDSGGISIKPAGGMGDMSLDMGGSAAVVGAMRALAARKAKAKVVSIVALAENMPDGKSYRPGDILTSMNGKTIYVDNTDAEGRLVLCDAMTYIQRTFNPHTVVDLATLTGAAVVALGTEFAAVYANDNKLWKKFNAASAASGEKIWRMPLTETDVYTRSIRSNDRADLTNSGGRAGSCGAAAFLHEFIEKDEKGKDKCNWMHIDMAGPGIPAGQIRKGWGVLLLDQLVRDHFEESAIIPAPANKKPPHPAGP